MTRKFKTKAVALLAIMFLSILSTVSVAVCADTLSPGFYVLEGDYMSGSFELKESSDRYEAEINLVMNREPHNTAGIGGTATIQGNKIVIVDEENAQAVITLLDGETLEIEANEKAEEFYTGLNATFTGTYIYRAGEKTSYNEEDGQSEPDNIYGIIVENIHNIAQRLIGDKKYTSERTETVHDEYGEAETVYKREWKYKNFQIVLGCGDKTWEDPFMLSFWTNDSSLDMGFGIKVGATLAEVEFCFKDNLRNLSSKEYDVLLDGISFSFIIEQDRVKSISFAYYGY